MSQNISTAVMQRRVEAHDSLDDFPTPSWAIRALMEKVLKPRLDNRLPLLTVREPCCNRGYMARPLGEYFGNVIATDIMDYGYADHMATVDYLYPRELTAAAWTIFNPPFRLALEFLLRSFETPGWEGSAMIVRNAFLEGGERYESLFSKNPPTIYAQFAERVIMTKGIVRDPNVKYWNPKAKDPKTGEKTGAMVYPTTATSYCWLIWLKDTPPQPPVWIPPCRRALEKAGDYA